LDTDQIIDQARQKQPHLHKLLKRILQIIPDSINNLMIALTSYYPHKSLLQVTQEYFLENLIEITAYCPAVLEFIVGLIIDRLIQIDVDIVLDEIPDEEETDELKEGVFVMEEDHRKVQDHIIAAKKLDGCISLIINWIKDSNETRRNEIFSSLMKAFDQSILLTHQCKYTQFIIFYICQLKSTYFECFVINHLLSLLLDDNCAGLIRISASSYIASFLGRSKFAPLQCTIKVCNRLAKWIHNYIYQHQNKHIDPTKHMLFYSTVQTLFYIIIFKHEELEELSQSTQLFKQLDISSIVYSQFYPFKIILSSVAEEFAKIVSQLNIGDFPFQETGESPFEFFFPFEPCLLKTTATHIQDYYAFWEGGDDNNDEDIEEVEEVCNMVTNSVSL